ncbi:MAG: hypothetical protein ABFE07_28140 [Armatimonadia bacterium]
MSSKKTPRVIIEVRGGAVQAIYSDGDLEWDILDWDDAKVDGEAKSRAEELAHEAKKLKDVTEWEG